MDDDMTPPLSEEAKKILAEKEKSKKATTGNTLLNKKDDKKLLNQEKPVEKKVKEEESEDLNKKVDEEKPVEKPEEKAPETIEELKEMEEEDKPDEWVNDETALNKFDIAFKDAKGDYSGSSILVWIKKNTENVSKLSKEAKEVIYGILSTNNFIKDIETTSFPEVPSDITPEEQSRSCITAFANKYLAGNQTKVFDEDTKSIKASVNSLKKEKEETIVTVNPAFNEFLKGKDVDQSDEVSTGMRR